MTVPKPKLPPGVSRHADRYGRVTFHARATIDGKRRSLGLHPTPEDASRAVEAALLLTRADGRGLTLAAYGERWLRERGTDGIHRAADKDTSTWRTHVATAHFAAFPLRRIARTDVHRWVKELLATEATSTSTTGRPGARVTERTGLGRKLGTQTIRNALGLLRRALGDAANEGLVGANPATGVRVPRRAADVETWAYLTAAEIDRVLALRLRPEQRAIYTVAIYTGLRGGELWGLRWMDVVLDAERPEIVVARSYRGPTKGGRVRRVPLFRQAREALEAWRREQPGIGAALVFPAETDEDGLAGCHAEGFDAGWPRVRRLAGITRRVRFHDLRHTCGSHLVQGTWGRAWRLEEVREMLGHRSITTTERYAHMAPERLQGARAEQDAATRKETMR
jgi:integrase